MDIQIVYEDKDTLVINKPVGVVVNRASTVTGETIQDWVAQRIKDQPGEWRGDGNLYVQRTGVCHRLDKETSGCLMIAKNKEALSFYLAEFKNRRVKKSYLALVHGRVEPVEGEVILPLRRSQFDRQKWQVHFEGKRAVTGWVVKGRYAYSETPHFRDSLTFLELSLKTGRTHQIRVHLSFLGWPIFSDDKYLNKSIAKKDREQLSHHFLHAERLEFTNFSGVRVKTSSPLPKDCLELLDRLMLE